MFISGFLLFYRFHHELGTQGLYTGAASSLANMAVFLLCTQMALYASESKTPAPHKRWDRLHPAWQESEGAESHSLPNGSDTCGEKDYAIRRKSG